MKKKMKEMMMHDLKTIAESADAITTYMDRLGRIPAVKLTRIGISCLRLSYALRLVEGPCPNIYDIADVEMPGTLLEMMQALAASSKRLGEVGRCMECNEAYGMDDDTELEDATEEELESMAYPEDLRWQVVLHNDDINTFAHVIEVLQSQLGCSMERAEQLAWRAHKADKTTCMIADERPALQMMEKLRDEGLSAYAEPLGGIPF